MNVLVPHIGHAVELAETLSNQGIRATFIDTSDPEGYYQMLSRAWRHGQTFILIEQDKIPAPGAVSELWDCPEPWCSFPVSMRGTVETSPYPSLSCTKFDAVLMEADPFLMLDVGEVDFGFGEREWSRLDMGVSAHLEMTGFRCHWHDAGRVEHKHGSEDNIRVSHAFCNGSKGVQGLGEYVG